MAEPQQRRHVRTALVFQNRAMADPQQRCQLLVADPLERRQLLESNPDVMNVMMTRRKKRSVANIMMNKIAENKSADIAQRAACFE